jgi:ADP-ribose pyrophosphatase
LGDYHNNTGAEANNVLLYFAELSSLGSPKLDEGIDRLWMADVGEFSEAIRSAAITDGFTIAAFTRAHLRGII